MTTLAADKVRVFAPVEERKQHYPVVASDIIYEGAAVGVVKASGHARPLTGDSTVEDFVGFAVRKVDNSAGAAADKDVEVRQQGVVLLKALGGTPTADNVLEPVYASDDDTFSLTQGANDPQIGVLQRFVSATECYVDFKGVGVS